MDCASNKERVFYVVKGDNDNYIENIYCRINLRSIEDAEIKYASVES